MGVEGLQAERPLSSTLGATNASPRIETCWCDDPLSVGAPLEDVFYRVTTGARGTRRGDPRRQVSVA
jgi:hypothetical protein